MSGKSEVKMREILFRGQSKIDRRWVYGCWDYGWYTKTKGYSLIRDLEMEIREPVYDKTIGQYVGIKDSIGNRIFEGDILKNVFGEYGIVEYSDNFFYIRKALVNDYSSECFSTSKIVGNIYDNTELIKDKKLDWRK